MGVPLYMPGYDHNRAHAMTNLSVHPRQYSIDIIGNHEAA